MPPPNAAPAEPAAAATAGRAAPAPPATDDEIYRLGEAIFERDVKPTLPPDPPNDYVLIDVDGGAWVTGPDPVACHEEMSRRTPGRLFSRRLLTPYVSRRR